MTSDQRRRVNALFEQAIDREQSGVAAGDFDRWLDAASEDAIVRDEVRSLMRHHIRAGRFLETPILDRVPDLIADETPLPAGAKVGSYTIVRELGRGGMGRVYEARDERLARVVALKAIAPQYAGDAAHRERLRREARLAAGLAHPGICTVFALEEIDDELYIASELVDGRTLRNEIAAGRRPSAEALLRVARELAAALAYAHAHGVVHRDLKPENVMLTAEDHVKILDFGLARMEASDRQQPVGFVTQSGVIVGTPAYMAPEQIEGRATDARTDVFAFGVVLSEYASGAHPFLGEAAGRAAALDGGMAGIVSRCLRKAPADRFASAGDVAAALDLVAGGGLPVARHSDWWRTHQIAVVVLYAIAATLSWQIKEWTKTPAATALFFALGAASTMGAVLRGHLVFIERVNRAGLPAERRRSARATRLVDIFVSVMLFADGILITERPLPSVLTLSLALGILLAALVVEPATTRAAFGDE